MGDSISGTTTATTTTTTAATTITGAVATSSSNNNGNGPTTTSTTTIATNKDSNNVQTTETIKAFENLLRKSQRLVIGLRDLPQFGRQWQPFFQKTFEIYTKLWKFQQQYRAILEDKSKYGLKRCEIGEIASKIGQLYYHYYLRTSDTNYLNESFIFYEAIRLRAYFKEVGDSKVPDMMVKQLRYYARFIVVCLLLNRKKVVFELVEELFKHVNDYTKIYKPQETQEWTLVLQEIFSFLQADQSITFTDSVSPTSTTGSGATTTTISPITISHRLNLNTFPSPPNHESLSILQQCILVGNHQNQIKFSEITLDMFRITQSLEYEILDFKDNTNNEQQKQEQQSTPTTTTTTTTNHTKKKNPNKYLLYRPTVSQLTVFLSNASKELTDNKALLLYLSVDGVQNDIQNNQSDNQNNIYNTLYSKGLIMNSNKPLPILSNNTTTSSSNTTSTTTTTTATSLHQNYMKFIENTNNNNCIRNDALYPIDLLPFCRKPFFLIIDSQSSNIFKDLPIFNQPFVSLLSPISTPKKIFMNNKSGNLFTFFLHDPLAAFCNITSATKLSSKSYLISNSILQTIMQRISNLLFESGNSNSNNEVSGLHPSFTYFMMDDFLRSYILRFIFCFATFHLHKEFQENIYQVSSTPEIPKSLLHHPIILNSIIELSNSLGVSDQFIEFVKQK